MAKAGKGVIKNSGQPTLSDDGQLVMFDVNGESCCCDFQPPADVHCKELRWNLVAPEGAKYPTIVNSPMPTCLPVTLNGGPFAGTYEISYISPVGGTYGERRTVIAQTDTTVPAINPSTGLVWAWYPIWAGHEYEIDFSFTVNEDGEFPQSGCYIKVRSLWPVALIPDTFYLDPPDPISNLTLNYTGENYFDQRSSARTLVPTGVLAEYFTDWDVSLNFIYRPRTVRAFPANGCSCEWNHPRYINHPQQINGSASDGLTRDIRFEADQGFGSIARAYQPLEATGFDYWDGWSMETAGGTYSAINNNDGTYNDVELQKRAPWMVGDSFKWDFTLNTQAFVRPTTNDPFIGFGGGVGGGTGETVVYSIVSDFLSGVPPFFGGISILRRFVAQPDTFDPTNTGELVSYYIIPPFSAQTHTQTAPTSNSVLIPWEKVLPNTTTGSIEAQFSRPIFERGFAYPNVEFCTGFEFLVTVTINGTVIYSDYVIKDFQDIRDFLWPRGYSNHYLTVSARPWRVDAAYPSLFDQFAGGFDDACKNWYSGSFTIQKSNYEAPEHCNREAPEIFLTSAGTKDLEAGTHEITFHVGEDIGTIAPPATVIHQANERNTTAMEMPMYIVDTDSTRVNSSSPEFPAGLSVSATGLMTGTPLTEGEWLVQHKFRDAFGFERCSWALKIIVKVRNPEFFYPDDYTSGGTNDQGVNWYMRDGDSGTIESNLSFGTEPYTIVETGDSPDGASFNSSTGDYTLNPAYVQIGDSSGTVTIGVTDATNKTDSVSYTWFRKGT